MPGRRNATQALFYCSVSVPDKHMHKAAPLSTALYTESAEMSVLQCNLPK